MSTLGCISLPPQHPFLLRKLAGYQHQLQALLANLLCALHSPFLPAPPAGDPGFLFVEDADGQRISAITSKQQLDEVRLLGSHAVLAKV